MALEPTSPPNGFRAARRARPSRGPSGTTAGLALRCIRFLASPVVTELYLLRTVAALCRAHLDPLANGGRRESESPRRPKKHGPCQRRCAGLVAQNPICHVCAAVPRHISVARAQRSAHLRPLKHFVGFRKHTEGKSPATAIGLTRRPAVDKRIGCSIRQHWSQGRADARLSWVGVCRGPAGR